MPYHAPLNTQGYQGYWLVVVRDLRLPLDVIGYAHHRIKVACLPELRPTFAGSIAICRNIFGHSSTEPYRCSIKEGK